ncbi:MAG: chalcone isomerase family protein [Aquabacterium sp.]|uniref:chalcone isomerase family protein n=1 Tax=Aquabacterium sp. TaxID=1872578 RepID=UPI0025B9C359|nr:chalcone isomerase family protein [Aquabacterium sp.]MBI5925715.1 chalcone isomerase family protein [Aquabacterium sp.]
MKPFARKLILSAILATALPAWAALDIKGAKFNDTYQLANQPLQLNGAGVRVKVIVDVYAAGLYVARKEHSASALLNQSGPKSMQIVLLRDLTGEDFADAMIKGFKKNNSDHEIARFQAKLEEVRNQMMAFGQVRKGTTIRIDNTPGNGTRVLVDGVQKGPEISGDDFYGALLRIWLGNSPVDSDLKDALLGAR